MKEIIFNFLKINGINIFQTIGKGFISIWTYVIRPFFFSKNKKHIIVPYVYVCIGMGLFIASVVLFIKLSWVAATTGIKDATIILPTISSVIGILVVMMTFMVKVYNEGKTTEVDTTEGDTSSISTETTTPVEPKPNGVI